MNPSSEEEFRPRSSLVIALTVVLNIIWWMVMIAAIGLGAIHLGHCPAQPRIPIYLMVLGAASLLSLSLSYTKSIWEDGYACILSSTCAGLFHFFTLGWFIAGTVWVYPVYPPNYTPGTVRYCQKTTYQFAFAVTTLLWTSMTLMVFCGFCFALLTCCKTVKARGRLIPNRPTLYGATAEEPTAGDV